MCGRTACTLAPDQLCRACRYTSRSRQQVTPAWRGAHTSTYSPNYNMAPSLFGPVLVAPGQKGEERHLQAMRWGLVPGWYTGPVRDLSLNINNCRADTMRSKRTFAAPLAKGRRCVVLADGFYEWYRPKGGGPKQPYFITFPEAGPGATGRRLLTMAGIYDINGHCLLSPDAPSQPTESDPLYSYTVITVDSKGTPLEHVHDRLPAILDSDEAIDAWLDPNVPLHEACSYIAPCKNIHLEKVSPLVNNARNNDPQCVQPLKEVQNPTPKKEQTRLSNWLVKLPKKSPKAESASAVGKGKPEKDMKVKQEDTEVKLVDTEMKQEDTEVKQEDSEPRSNKRDSNCQPEGPSSKVIKIEQEISH